MFIFAVELSFTDFHLSW